MSEPTTIDSGEREFQERTELNSHLAWESFIALARHPNRVLITDRTLRRREMKSGLLLALAWSVSRQLLDWTDLSRVGIVFPPGIGACIANLAVVLVGKVPVNLNFTLGRVSAKFRLTGTFPTSTTAGQSEFYTRTCECRGVPAKGRD